MKKIILPLLALIFCSQFATAQKLQFGVQGGLNLANVVLDETGNIDYEASLRTAFNGGIYTQVSLLNDKFVIQPGLMYSAEGFVNKTNDASSEDDEVKTNMNFMNIPVTLMFKPTKFLNFQIGPEFGVLLKAVADGDNVSEAFNKSELGLNLGVGTTIAKVLDVNVRYNRGLTKMYDGSAEALVGDEPQAGSDGNVTLLNNSFQVSLGLNLSNLLGAGK